MIEISVKLHKKYRREINVVQYLRCSTYFSNALKRTYYCLRLYSQFESQFQSFWVSLLICLNKYYYSYYIFRNIYDVSVILSVSVSFFPDIKCGNSNWRRTMAPGATRRHASHSIFGGHVWKRPHGRTPIIFTTLRRDRFVEGPTQRSKVRAFLIHILLHRVWCILQKKELLDFTPTRLQPQLISFQCICIVFVLH